MDVVILAGAPAPPGTDVEWRADLPVGGSRMIDRVLAAVAGFGPVTVVGGPEVKGVGRVLGGEKFVDSLRSGLEASTSESVLVVTADVPFLTREAVEDFLARCDPQADFCYPVVRAESCERDFPGMPRTTLRVREGVFTGGNLALVRRAFVARSLPRIEAGYAARKSPLKLAGLVGAGLLARILLAKLLPGTVTLGGLESSIGRFLHARVQAVPTDYAGIGADVDSLSQYRLLLDLQNASRSADNTV